MAKEGRVFVRGMVNGQYGLEDERQRIRNFPRVIKAKDIPWEGGPVQFSKTIVDPESNPSQMLFVHMDVLAPGGKSQKHGHQNEALFYVLDGEGYEIHDGERYDWEAGDVMVVHNECVHQHFNADPDKPARTVIIKTKPLFMFMNLITQRTVEKSPAGPDTGYEPEPW